MMHYLLMINGKLDCVYEKKKYADITADYHKLQGKSVQVKRKKLTESEIEYFKQHGMYAQLQS